MKRLPMGDARRGRPHRCRCRAPSHTQRGRRRRRGDHGGHPRRPVGNSHIEMGVKAAQDRRAHRRRGRPAVSHDLRRDPAHGRFSSNSRSCPTDADVADSAAEPCHSPDRLRPARRHVRGVPEVAGRGAVRGGRVLLEGHAQARRPNSGTRRRAATLGKRAKFSPFHSNLVRAASGLPRKASSDAVARDHPS